MPLGRGREWKFSPTASTANTAAGRLQRVRVAEAGQSAKTVLPYRAC